MQVPAHTIQNTTQFPKNGKACIVCNLYSSRISQQTKLGDDDWDLLGKVAYNFWDYKLMSDSYL